MAKKVNDVLETIAKSNVSAVELRYTDGAGAWRRASVPAASLDATAFDDGIAVGTDASLLPDPASIHVDPSFAPAVVSLTCELLDASGEDPRRLLKRALARLTASGLGDALFASCELRYYLFATAAYENAPDATGYRLEAASARAIDELRAELAVAFEAGGTGVDLQHDIAGAPGQSALHLRPRTLVEAADAIMSAKHAVKTLAERRGAEATFMPKPLAGAPGSGSRVRLSLRKDAKTPFYDKDGWAGCSQTMLYFIGGLLAHAGALLALNAPSTNSYRRLAGAGEPMHVAFGANAPTAALGVVATRGDARLQAIEYRPGDASANPYLSFAALLCAGLDGVTRRIDPISRGFGPYEPAAGAPTAPRTLPQTLGEALDALEQDRAFLTEGGVYDDAFLRRWIAQRRDADVAPLATRPHPYEFARSYDC